MPRTRKLPTKETTVVAIRCTPRFRDHLFGIGEAETRTPTQVIERALKAYAEANGHKPFPPR